MGDSDVIVIGAGASGLGVAAVLQRRGRIPVILDRDDQIGGSWARRYDRLCLHTTKRFSGLPYLSMPRRYPRYVPKDLYATYLADYADRMRLDVRLGQSVNRICRSDNGRWLVSTSDGTWRSSTVVVATGKHLVPRLPRWPGMDTFEGRLLNAADYRTGRDFTGLRALVIGIGNSGAEIAADLVEHGAASVTISIRTPPPISAREIFGIPVQILGMLLAPFPPQLVDRAGSIMRRAGTGDLTRFGIGREAWGPFTTRRPPVIDVGFVEQLRAGQISVASGIDCFTRNGVRFIDGGSERFDVVIAATGFTTGLERLIDATGVLDDRGLPVSSSPIDGLYFAGFTESPRGQLFESSRDAHKIARSIDRYLRGKS